MSFTGVGAPRNTSNGDYGRFHFLSNMTGNQQMQQQNAHFSTDGSRMMQHVHYPNCPNRTAPNTFTDGVKEYTVEYGEDAVRAALGGKMPDFQAQFQNQYGGGDTGTTGESSQNQTIQMQTNGNSKVSMIPVVLTSEGDGNETDNGGSTGVKAEVSMSSSTVGNAPSQASADVSQTTGESGSNCETGAQQESPNAATSASKQENITNAFESARKARSNGQVKYGRHVRPSYWKPETPNPCRKKMAGGGGDVNDVVDNNNQEEMRAPVFEFPSTGISNSPEMMSNANAYFAPPPMVPANDQQQSVFTHQRTRSLPPRQAVRPTYSLCGKCKKCKNLRSDTPEASVLTFTKYATDGSQRNPRRSPQMLTSSNLGQSAKNFRAIRFSSNHM